MSSSDKSFLIKLTVSLSFFLLTPIVILISLISLIYIRNGNTENSNNISSVKTTENYNGFSLFASLPSNELVVYAEVNSEDSRIPLIKKYLEYYNSPLSAFSDLIVSESDKYQLDYRLTTAISQQESNLCKYIPDDSFNCWGWGIHSKGVLKFTSYEEGIREVTKGLRESYIDVGFLTIDKIMSRYTPLSNGSWSFGVSKFLDEIENLSYL